jgi:alpha-galactosidase
MVKISKNAFLLSSKGTTLLLRVDPNGKIVSDYYGRRIAEGDEAALERKVACGSGTAVAYDEKQDPALSLDNIRSEVATPLKGDYHEPSLIVSSAESALYDFSFASAEVVTPEKIPGLPTPHGAREELRIHLTDLSQPGVLLTLHYLVYEEEDVFGRYLSLENQGPEPISLHRFMSYQLVLPNQGFRLLTLHGAWAMEGQREETPLSHGRHSFGSISGSSSNRFNPLFFLLSKESTRNDGSVYGFNLVYSGNHEESVELDTFDYVRIQVGLSDFLFEKKLSQGESFASPLGVMTYSERGLDGVSGHFQSFVNDCVIRESWKGVDRPIIYNNWEATTFDFKKGDLVSLMKKAASLGVETFVLDDGWFGSRNDDSHGLGDWEENTKKIPGGLPALCEKASKLGLHFGIWMEPEMVNPLSQCYQAHPDWVIKEAHHDPALSRHQLTLDLRKSEVQDFIFASVSRVLGSAPISYLKWDYNRPMSDVPGGYGTFFHDYMLGLYRVLERLTAAFPQVLFENCASGGNRFDLGMLSYFPQSWVSDDTDSLERLFIQSGMALGYPLSVLSNHVSAKTSNQLLRYSSLDSKFDVAAFGVLGYELDLNDLTPLEEGIIKGQIAYYKEHRHLCQWGTFHELYGSWAEDGLGFEVTDGKDALIGRYEILQKLISPEGFLGGVGFLADHRYHFATRQESISLKKFGHLINAVTPIHLKEDGFLVNELSKRKDMKSEVDEGECSGSALLAYGVALSPEWAGTGYNDRIRLVGDFGGRLYFLKDLA